MRAWPIAVVAALAACGGHTSPHSPDGPSGDGAVDGSVDAIPPGFTKLITRTWSLQPGQVDTYECTRIQVPTDMWVTAFRLLGPEGTHHLVLTYDPSDSQTGDYDCMSTSGTLDGQMIYAAGIGTDDLALPAGVAVHLAAGQWINLNLHLFDATDNPLSGESGVLVETVPQSQVVNEADMMFSGTEVIDVPSDGNTHMAVGGCSAPADWHLFALWPHMHLTGVHQTFAVNSLASGTQTMLLNADYNVSDQKNYPMQDFLVHAGDQIVTTCTFQVPAQTCDGSTPCTLGTCNMTDHRCYMTFGDSADSEMCFTGMYKYPAGGNTFGCVQM